MESEAGNAVNDVSASSWSSYRGDLRLGRSIWRSAFLETVVTIRSTLIVPLQVVRGDLDTEDCELLGGEEEVPAWADDSENCRLDVDVFRWWASMKRHNVRWLATEQSMLGDFGRGPTWLPSLSKLFQRLRC